MGRVAHGDAIFNPQDEMGAGSRRYMFYKLVRENLAAHDAFFVKTLTNIHRPTLDPNLFSFH